MNDLSTTQNSTLSRPTSPVLGKALSELLDSAASPDAAAREIAETPALLSEAKGALSALQAVATAKAGEDGVRRVIAKRFETYPQPQRSDEGWAGWWADYFDALSHVSLASLEAAMRAYVARPDSEFMPKPGKLLELSTTTPCRSLQRYYRAKRAIQLSEEVAQVAAPRVDPRDVKEMLKEFEAKSVGSVKAKPELPNTAGKVDEGGITAQMRALIASRDLSRSSGSALEGEG